MHDQLLRLSAYHALRAIFPNSSARFHSLRIEVPQPQPNKFGWFRLVRFRSPLLSESLSFYFPGVTEMFHFAPFRFDRL